MAITSIKSLVISLITISLCNINSVTVSACQYSCPDLAPSTDCPDIAPSTDCPDLAPSTDCPDIASIKPTDMDTDCGGWIVFQRRFDGSVDFYRGWDDYEQGFGNFPDGEYWLGLSIIHRLTQQGTWELRIDLQAFDDSTSYAEYDSFSVGDAASNYTLSVGRYSGVAGHSLTTNYPFSTHDRDNDGDSAVNCAEFRYGAWWYTKSATRCSHSNLNGQVRQGSIKYSYTGMTWSGHWRGSSEVLKRSEMKMRRIQ